MSSPRDIPYRTLLFCAVLLISSPSLSSTDATENAIYPLFKVINEKLPRASSCYGVYHDSREATIGDVIIAQLSNLDAGKNTISGKCGKGGLCYLDINHSAGEDVSSFHIQFVNRDGNAEVSTVKCVITP